MRHEVAARDRGRMRIAVLLGAAAVLAFAPAAAHADDAGAYLKSAHQLERSHHLRGAEIELRNAAQAAPDNGAIRLELARVYLDLHNPNAAEAELFAAPMRGTEEEETAPLMAQAMLEMGELGDLLKNVPAGTRPAKIESVVRSYRGMAELGLGEIDRARAMFADAERLDPKSALPLVGETRLLIQQHELDAAARKIDAALAIEPGNSDALEAKALILALEGNSAGAMHQFAAAIAADPENVRAMIDRANLEMAKGNLAAAESDLAAIRKLAPGSVMAAYLQAAIDAQQGKYREADALLDRLRSVMNGFPAAYLIAAEVKFKLNEFDQAEAFARKFVAQSKDPKGWQLLGAIALRRGDLEGGIAALEKAAELAPNDANILAALGQAYVASGELEKAKNAFGEAAAKAPGSAPVATEQALADFASGDREDSVAALSNVFRAGKGGLMAGPPLVIEALQLGRFDIAEATARQLLEHDPANVTYQELLAAARAGQHDYAGAETLLRGLLARQPNLASARRDLAQIYLSTNRAPAAKKLYQDRLAANPKDIDSLAGLAAIAFEERDDAEAIRLLTEAQNAAPSDPRPSLRILAILEARKRWPEALGRARALTARFGKDPRVADMLGHLYFESGNRAASAATYRAAVAKFPRYAPLFAHDAAVLAAGRDDAGAAALALRATQIDPRNNEIRQQYVNFVYLAKGADAAIAASRTMMGQGPAAALLASGVLDASGNRATAISLLEKQQAERPSSAVAVRLAGLYERDNRLSDASKLLEAWAAGHASDVDARFALAQLDSAAGRLNDALVQYQWLAAQRPDNAVFLNNLAWLYDSNHDPRARATAERAMKLAPQSGSVADTLGWILAEQGDAAGAAKYLAQASAAEPADAAVQYHYAVVLSKVGKPDQARDVLQKLLKLNIQNPTRSDAQMLLAKLGAQQ